MSNIPIPRYEEIPPGKYGTLTVLPYAGPGNATPEELAWPVVTPDEDATTHTDSTKLEPGAAVSDQPDHNQVTPHTEDSAD